jgi:hypothetical protein
MTYKEAMRALAPLVDRCRSALPWLAVLGLGAGITLATSVMLSRAGADVMDPTVEKTIAIGAGSAYWPTDRGAPQRNGRAVSLPSVPRRKWKHASSGPIAFPPLVAGDSGVLVLVAVSGGTGIETSLLDLAPTTGATRHATRIGDVAAAPPLLLASGLRVVISVRDAIGIDEGGNIRFRTALGGNVASSGRAFAVPLPTGGFTVARAGELIELDSAGNVAGRVKLDIAVPLAARDNGDTVAVASNGDLFTWRAGKVPRLVGTFGDKTLLSTGVAQICPLGPVVDGISGSAMPGKRRERALCALANESLIEQIDLGTGKRSAVLATPMPLVRFRTLMAVGASGDLAVGTSDGTVSGISATGLGYGPIDIPGSVSMLGLGKDAGVFGLSAQGEFAPIVADDGAVLFGSSEGVAIAYPTGLVTRIAKCTGGALATVSGVASAGPNGIVLACSNGDVELIGEGVPTPPPPPPPPPSNSALEPMPIPGPISSGGDAGP